MTETKQEIPWYIAGLAFECLECGGCCSGPDEGFVWCTDDEIETMADHLRMTEQAFRGRYVRRIGRRFSLVEAKINKDCIFLRDGKCQIYSVRPVQCRTWPFWERNLETPDDWSWAASRCPGINRGTVHDLPEIIEKARSTKE